MLLNQVRNWSKKRLPQTSGRIYLPHLKRPVSIDRDRWGIPHITAENRADLFLAQGFVQAQDRFWQMELNRRAAQGRLSELFGPLTLQTDRISRTLGFARLAAADWHSLAGPEAADLVAYTKGVNAWLHSEPALPLEFSLIRHTPAPWEPGDSLSYGRLQIWALTHGALGELVQAQLDSRLGPDLAADLALIYPESNPSTLPHGIENTGLRLDGLLGPWTHPFLGKGSLDGAGRGSNAWVVGPQQSASGHALLCNDMHLPVGIPSLWYALHLHSQDGFHTAGFSLPGLPYILVGHNEAIAWGATLAYTDCEDLFIEKCHPEQPHTYALGEGWHEAAVFQESIPVRGRKPYTETVVVTHHGPILNNVLVDHPLPLALSSTALAAGISLAGFRLLNSAANWDDFVTAVAHIQAPSLNLVYADREDNIGYYVSGRVPIRADGDGTRPAPGWTGSHEWTGTIPFADMPHALNPESGVIITANNRIAPADYPYYLGQMWRNGYRARRLEQLITDQAPISVADCARFHQDLYSIPGAALRDWLGEFETSDADADFALQQLQAWDGRLNSESSGGAVFEVLIRQLGQAILAPHLDENLRNQVLGLGADPLIHPVNEFQGQWLVSLLKILNDAEPFWLPDPQTLVTKCLSQTTAELRRRLGADPAGWQWGRLHRITFAHPFGIAPPLKQLFNRGPFPIGGDENTVAQTSIRPDLPYDNNAISISTRLIIDMGEIENAQAVHPPGQSGHLGSPHYDDLIPLWRHGRYYQLLWTEPAVKAGSRQQLTLVPPLTTL